MEDFPASFSSALLLVDTTVAELEAPVDGLI